MFNSVTKWNGQTAGNTGSINRTHGSRSNRTRTALCSINATYQRNDRTDNQMHRVPTTIYGSHKLSIYTWDHLHISFSMKRRQTTGISLYITVY